MDAAIGAEADLEDESRKLESGRRFPWGLKKLEDLLVFELFIYPGNRTGKRTLLRAIV
jgi:hypothetical protein